MKRASPFRATQRAAGALLNFVGGLADDSRRGWRRTGPRLAHGGAREWIHGKDGLAGRWWQVKWRLPRVSPA